MATQTYCDADDVKEIIGRVAHDFAIDDGEDGLLSTAESAHVTNSIERAATLINSYLAQRYVLSDLASSNWCKWVNAEWAAMLLLERRANPAAGALAGNVELYREVLAMVRDNNAMIPDATSSIARRPSVSNYDLDRTRTDTPIVVDTQSSTGSDQSSFLKQRV